MATKIGELAVRRSIEINATPQRIWREFSSAERFRLWYTAAGGVDMPCKRMEYEPRAGGVFETEGFGEWSGGRHDFHWTGEVLVYDPPRELTIEFRIASLDVPMLLTWLLTPVEGGRTNVELAQHGFERFGATAADLHKMFEGGWDMVVPTALRNLVETGKATG